MSILAVDRRTFLKIGGTAAGGLLVACYVRRELGPTSSGAFRPNGYVRIDADGGVVLWSKNPDMGQGSGAARAAAKRRATRWCLPPELLNLLFKYFRLSVQEIGARFQRGGAALGELITRPEGQGPSTTLSG